MISEPKQAIFLNIFNQYMNNYKLITCFPGTKDYTDAVLQLSDPLALTRIIHDMGLPDTIKILPCDFFCWGSMGIVPRTKNSCVYHKV